MKNLRLAAALLLLTALSACGGGGGAAGTCSGSTAVCQGAVSVTLPFTDPVLPDSGTVQNLCQAPRTGTDPFNGNLPYPDKPGTLASEKLWLRSWIDETYLWYREVPANLDPVNYATAIDYFNVLKTSAITSSGKARDQFHFTYPSAEWDAISQQGVELGYGISWSRSGTVPRKRVVAIVEPGSSADQAGVRRGDQLLMIDGVDYVNALDSASVDIINKGLFPPSVGEIHTLILTLIPLRVNIRVWISTIGR